MTRGPGLRSYLEQAAPVIGAGRAPSAPWQPRPPGPLIWVHGADPSEARALGALAARMAAEDGGMTWLSTDSDTAVPGLLHQPAPAESATALRAFLGHWRPDLLIWMSRPVVPGLLAEADRAGIPRILAGADSAVLGPVRPGWRPGRRRTHVEGFLRALAVDQPAAARLRRGGLAPDRIEVTGRLQETAVPLPCDDDARARAAEQMGHRPVWLAAETGADEAPLVLRAHRRASRRTHRLLLILHPGEGCDGAPLMRELEEHGVETIRRSEGAAPEEATQVILADRPDELGLWYRLAPITFLGGTLVSAGPGGRDPFEPAALGSAILHGPRLAPWEESYRRLARAGATRSVRSAEDLGAAVEGLLAPDRAAALAHAGWTTVSEGAEVTNRLMDLVRETLYGPEG